VMKNKRDALWAVRTREAVALAGKGDIKHAKVQLLKAMTGDGINQVDPFLYVADDFHYSLLC
jgi:hypothetical protein